MDLENNSDSELSIRVVLQGAGGSFATDQAIALAAGGGAFERASLSLKPEDLTFVVGGVNDVNATLGNVTAVRILHCSFPALMGDPVVAQLTVDNITALAEPLTCATGIDVKAAVAVAKADVPAGVLLLPVFEVDAVNPGGLTTFVTVHNQTDEPRVARFQIFDTESNLQAFQDFALTPRQTQPVNLRSVPDLTLDGDGIARGWVQILSCSDTGGELGSSLTGDYLFLDNDGNFATGDQLLRPEDLCGTLQVRLVNFGSGVKVRLYSSAPQGPFDATALFTV